MALIDFDPSTVPARTAIDCLAAYDAFVGWKPIRKAGRPKPVKMPINPRTGMNASASDRSSWGSFEAASAAVLKYKLAGIGFVLSREDEFTGIDLDSCRDPITGKLSDLAQMVVDLGETYCEISPSGKGLRLFSLGKIARVRKSDALGIELYVDLRYLTITGNRVEGTPDSIEEAPLTLALLNSELDKVSKTRKEHAEPTHINFSTFDDRPTTRGDGISFFQKVKRESLANIGAWFPELFPCAYESKLGWRVSSADLGRDLEEDISATPEGIKDFGVADMGDAREGGRSAIDLVLEWGNASTPYEAAVWLCDGMGIDSESLRDDLEGIVHDPAMKELSEAEPAPTATESQANEAPAADTPPHDPETGEILEPVAPESPLEANLRFGAANVPLTPLVDYHADVSTCTGLVGDLTNWIIRGADYPQPLLSMGAALVIVGTAAGRMYAGPTMSGTHLYVAGLANTGTGKDQPINGVVQAFIDANLKHLIGPGEFTSVGAVTNAIMRSPSSASALDELGEFFSKLKSRNASNHERGISGILRKVWGKSFKSLPLTERAGGEFEVVHWPNFSLFGISNQAEFFGALSGSDTTSGLLNRFLFLESAEHPQHQLKTVSDLPADICKRLCAIHWKQGPEPLELPSGRSKGADPIVVQWNCDDSKRVYLNLVEAIRKRCEIEPKQRDFLVRTAEIAVRLATIRAIGITCANPRITVEDMQWGAVLSADSSERLIIAAQENIADNDRQRFANVIFKAIKSATIKNGYAKTRDIQQSIDQQLSSVQINDIVTTLCAAERIVEIAIPDKRSKGKAKPKMLKAWKIP